MATGPCEVLEQNEECPDPIKELLTQKENTQKQDAKIAAGEQGIHHTPNGIEKGEKLHVVEMDLDEFVDSVSEASPLLHPEKLAEAEEQPAPEKTPVKLPRAEQVAEKVLRAEKVAERPLRAEKLPGAEKAPEPKVTRVEKTPRIEKPVQSEKPVEKPRPKAPAAAKTVPVRRKTDARGASPAKDTLPWEGLTLNKCLLVASFVALLSMGCQVVQDIIEFGEEVLRTEFGAWILQEGSPQDGGVGELDERWFYERWFDWSDLEEPPDVEEELLEIEEEELIVESAGVEEEDSVVEEEEELEEEAKGRPKKSQEKVSRREKPSKDKALKSRRAREHADEEDEEEEEEEEKQSLGERHHRKRKGDREDGRSRPHKHGDAARPSKEPKRGRPPKDEHEKTKGRPRPKHEGKARPAEPKDRKPWPAPRPFFAPHKDGAHRFGKPKWQEGKRHD